MISRPPSSLYCLGCCPNWKSLCTNIVRVVRHDIGIVPRATVGGGRWSMGFCLLAIPGTLLFLTQTTQTAKTKP